MWDNSNIFTFKHNNPHDNMLLNMNLKNDKLNWNNDIVNILTNKRLDFTEDILVYVGFGKRATTAYLENLKLLTYNETMVANVKQNYIYNKLQNKEYICIHIRGTDKIILNNETYENYVQKMIIKTYENIKNSTIKNILILTDDPKLRSLFIKKMNMNDYTILFNNNIKQTDGIHHIKKDKNNEYLKYQSNIDMLIDFYLMTNSKILISDNDSWFSKMANHIKQKNHKLINFETNINNNNKNIQVNNKIIQVNNKIINNIHKDIKIIIPKNHQEIFDWENKLDNLYNLIVILPNIDSDGKQNIWQYKISSNKVLKIDLKLPKIYNVEYYYYSIYKESSKLLKNYYKNKLTEINNYNVILMDNLKLSFAEFYEMKFIKYLGSNIIPHSSASNDTKTIYKIGQSIFENHINKLHNKYQNVKLRKIKPIQECQLNALLIDNRCNVNLETQLLNTIYFTEDDVGFQIMTTPENKINVENIIEKYNLENIVITVVNLDSKNISQFLFSEEFYQNVCLFKVFIYQLDSLLLKKLDKKYYKYDWIGAPWAEINLKQYNLHDKMIPVGNGGFNIRNISLCRKIADKFNYNIKEACEIFNSNDTYAEDIVYSYHLQTDNNIDANIPEANIAKCFSIEDPIDLNTEIIGFHNTYTYFQNYKSIELFENILDNHYNSINVYTIDNKNININKINVFYRISDKGRRDGKPDYITLENCLNNFYEHFKNETIIFIADNCEIETISMINNIVKDANIIETKLGNSQSFLFTLNTIINSNYHDDSIIYFVEDDYLHLENSVKVMKEGLEKADYVTLYDHSDKYGKNSVNPFVKDGGETTTVFKTDSRMWKLTNSTTMTFATKYKTLKEDYSTIIKYLNDKLPDDFYLFQDLINNKLRKLASPLPGLSTHGQNPWLAPLIEWDKVVKKDKY